MALDFLGNTIGTGQKYVLAGTVRRIDGDSVIVVTGDGGEVAVRVKAGDIISVSDASSGGGGGAPTSAEYLVGALDGTLSAERLVEDTATVAWDLGTAGRAKANVPDGSTTTKGVVELATNGENAANVVVQGNDGRLSDARTPTTHQSSHQSGGGDPITGILDAVARTSVRKNSGADVGARRRLNLIEGTNITLTIADGTPNEEVSVTIDAAGGSGAPTGAAYCLHDSAGSSGLTNFRVIADTTSIVKDLATEGSFAFRRAALTGDVTASENSNATTIASGVVGNTKLATMAANTVKVNNTASGAAPTDMSVGTNTVVGRVGSNIVAATLVDAQVTADSITVGKLHATATDKLFGRSTAGAGAGEEITCTSTGRSILDDTSVGAVRQTIGFTSDNQWQLVNKSTDQQKNSDTTLANDSTLTFSASASTKYAFKFAVQWDQANATMDFQFTVSGPTSPALVRYHYRVQGPGETSYSTIGTDQGFATSHAVLTASGTNGGWLFIEGILHNSTNAGTVGFQWAQNTSDAGALVVRAGSCLEWRQVS